MRRLISGYHAPVYMEQSEITPHPLVCYIGQDQRPITDDYWDLEPPLNLSLWLLPLPAPHPLAERQASHRRGCLSDWEHPWYVGGGSMIGLNGHVVYEGQGMSRFSQFLGCNGSLWRVPLGELED